jgi:quercetin 2,3-dioxygenase
VFFRNNYIPSFEKDVAMKDFRPVIKIRRGVQTSDGAGVRLTRMFSDNDVVDMDPFLLLDLFGSNRVQDYIAGFPLHPHRGIETVTYMLDGYVDHKDSIGNKGTIGPGDVQWMTAGSGIMHEEMPRRSEGWMRGLQLWVNLPRSKKMIPPRYRGITRDEIPMVDLGGGSSVKVLAGNFEGTVGPVKDLSVEVEYLDVQLGPEAEFEHGIESGMNTFSAVYDGSTTLGNEAADEVGTGNVALFGKGDAVKAVGGIHGSRFLLVSGRPLREPIAWGGPIVMNTEEELDRAFREIRDNTFIKRSDRG